MDANVAEELRSLKWLLLYQIKRAVRCDAFGNAQALADLFNTLEYGQRDASDPLAVDETSERLGAGAWEPDPEDLPADFLREVKQ